MDPASLFEWAQAPVSSSAFPILLQIFTVFKQPREQNDPELALPVLAETQSRK